MEFPKPKPYLDVDLQISDEDYPTTPLVTISVGPLDTFEDVLAKYEDALTRQEGTAA